MSIPFRTLRRRGPAAVVAALTMTGNLWAGTAWAANAQCTAPKAGTAATSGAKTPRIIELYTSEGCSSCPPADHWLSGLKGRDDVVALAFHVDYWDRLGWKDRFASPAFSQRQEDIRAQVGARFVYTPQVVIDGRSTQDWGGDLRHGSALSPVDVRIERRGDHIVAQVRPAAGSPTKLAAYWALTENDQVSQVRAGENRGATLRHDFVVRDYRTVAAWDATAGKTTELDYVPTRPAGDAAANDVTLVVFDASTGKPLQAVKLPCAVGSAG